MLSQQVLISVSRFQTELLKLNQCKDSEESFSKQFQQLLSDYFNIKCSFSAFLGHQAERHYSPNVIINGIESRHVLAFLSEIWDSKDTWLLQENIVRLSDLPQYKKSGLYRNVLKPAGFQDVISAFLPHPESDGYIGYMVALFPKRAAADQELELIQFLSPILSAAFQNYIRIWDLQNRINLLRSCTNYYPVGIMVVENSNNVTFTNDLARRYLKELGYADPRFYGIFYNNELYRYHQRHLMDYSSSSAVRIKDFLFSTQAIGNPGRDLSQLKMIHTQDSMDKADMDAGNPMAGVSTCVYIIKDKHSVSEISSMTIHTLGLTDREEEIIRHILDGLNNGQIAEKMYISTNTVKAHISSIFRKLGVSKRSECIKRIYEEESKQRNWK